LPNLESLAGPSNDQSFVPVAAEYATVDDTSSAPGGSTSFAPVDRLVEPRTSYNVGRVLREFRSGQSNLGAMVTSVSRENDFGATAGGPIWIPKLYDGHNKSFFYVAYENYRDRNFLLGAPNRTVPLPEFYDGDFSRLLAGPDWEPPDKRQLFLGTHQTSFRISRLELEPLAKSGRVSRRSPANQKRPK
jgi:hypothetical protein